jgi:hypothetical protein
MRARGKGSIAIESGADPSIRASPAGSRLGFVDAREVPWKTRGKRMSTAFEQGPS